jgi:hypothetical protein
MKLPKAKQLKTSGKAKQARPFKGLFNSKRLLLAAVLLIPAVIIAGTGWYVVHVKNSVYNNPYVGYTDYASLKVESEPAGIDVAGSPACDSKKFSKTTPYQCAAGMSFTTTLTAQDTVSVNGQTYVFKTWDGCSESNADKKICKVKVKIGVHANAKATYEPKASSSATSTLIGCPAPSKYVIIGPQSFVPEKPEKLLLYNSSRNFQKPTYAQFVSGNTCKEIPLNVPLQAIAAEGLNAGYGLAASSFVTGSSQRTTIAPGSHAYIAVDDSPRRYLEAIFRDDGKLMIDEPGIASKFGVSADKTGAPWEFWGWQDNHTVLIWVKTGSSAGWYYYDLDTDTAVIGPAA